MIFSENRFPLFGIVLQDRATRMQAGSELVKSFLVSQLSLNPVAPQTAPYFLFSAIPDGKPLRTFPGIA
ncbi:hypothetical protein EN828_07565 [Mesorhizobium sp. M2D.F.Ca.ET.185.01.1.1]|uniref:hypothetical protein n=1 Tax=unclassified Mesorhizobium TaxID=325217 RepID=UPI000FC9D8A9|nr:MULTISPECIES: hypothetical protein [unclassified Mesorhizobium]TGP82444.1 hypothetical protein EN870_04110 [bacterium M00.F.Ca.ET.227.01.1.1]TGP94198.1 hypothetical protein EN864_12080 [bacterium M00.F.Ca.ET.221.01.1.1]TGP97653.1 hypothetical protein EN865_08305 [bacterium M00.F.Ca.ET.222.01.1.1]TGU12035.1 hypothetical protein EN806_21275 [bacterium M00.F.Ca.ET.163.01.1.1]TGU35709.1 hypothetical protein EN799_15995 [bacterium M00.F.Ca.ET.156.01.1.1]TGU48634.1 hypothetical protein EN789_074